MVPAHRELEKKVEGREQAVVAEADAWAGLRLRAQRGFVFALSAGIDNLISEECLALSKSAPNVAQLWRENKPNSENRRT